MVGKEIGNYRIVEKIGAGGMGVVYKAIDMHLDRVVAVKALSPEFSGNPMLLERFRGEARAQAQLNHPNLATLYAFLVQDEVAYMEMCIRDRLILALSRSQLIDTQHPGVEAEITQTVVEQRSLHVVTAARFVPGNCGFAIRDVTGGVGAYGVNGPPLAAVSYTHLDVYKRQTLDILGIQTPDYM